jgi:hypothetical protein
MMAEHYTKNTLECTAWCGKCQRDTQHRVDGGRRGPCLEHGSGGPSKKQLAAKEKREKRAMNPGLFE